MTSSHPFDDEIDLREIVVALLPYKWVILSVTLALALGGYLFTKLVLPKQYESTAVVRGDYHQTALHGQF